MSRYATFIAGRYLFSKKKRNAINIISSIAVLAFTVCTAALIIILSTMNGFEELIFSMYGKFNPDLKLIPVQGKTFQDKEASGYIGNLKGVKSIFEVLEDQAAIRNGDYQTVCTVKGVDPDYFSANGLSAYISEGDAVLFEKGIQYAILGAGIDQKINADIGGPFGTVSLLTPRRGDFSVSDPEAIRDLQIHPSGVVTMDEVISNRYVFVPRNFADDLFERNGQVSSMEVRLHDFSQAGKIRKAIEEQYGNRLKILDRYEQQASLYKMFRSEKWASYAILTFILLIAAFNTLGSLTMLVIEKKRDIMTLSSLGARPRGIMRIFLINGLMIAGIGTIAGLVTGSSLVLLQDRYGLVKMQGAIIENYPVKLMGNDVLLVAATALLLGALAAVYPAFNAKKLAQRTG